MVPTSLMVWRIQALADGRPEGTNVRRTKREVVGGKMKKKIYVLDDDYFAHNMYTNRHTRTHTA